MVSSQMDLKPTQLTLGQWNRLRERLTQDYPPSYIIMRSVMQRELGFTVRRHAHWVRDTTPHKGVDERGHYRDCVYLDWYDANLKTFFLLKYTEYIHK
jgi:hypothetical protein